MRKDFLLQYLEFKKKCLDVCRRWNFEVDPQRGCLVTEVTLTLKFITFFILLIATQNQTLVLSSGPVPEVCQNQDCTRMVALKYVFQGNIFARKEPKKICEICEICLQVFFLP